MYATVLNTEPERLLIADKIAYRTIGHFSIKFLHIELITIWIKTTAHFGQF